MTSSRASAAAALVLTATLLFVGCRTLAIGEWRDAPAATAGQHEGRVDYRVQPELRWQVQLDALPAGAPTVIEPYVLVASRRGDLVALDAENGTRRGRTRPGRAIAGSAVVAGNLALVADEGPGDTVLAFDLRRGRIQWRARGVSVQSSPLSMGDDVIVGGRDGRVVALDLRDGTERWSVVPDSSAAFLSSPIRGGDFVVVADDRGALTAFTRSGDVLWRAAAPGPIVHSPAGSAEIIAASLAAGAVCALRTASGYLLWCYHTEDPLVRLSSPVIVDSLVLVAGTDGILRALDAATGAPRWRHLGPAGIGAAPAVAGAVALVGDLRGNLRGVAIADGELLWSIPLDGRIIDEPTVAAGRVYVAVAPRQVVALAWKQMPVHP